ncbi:uncharacterized protein LOC123663195 isoform X2 [Melitaea cinxia]|uniref:uncharacterized protein LOC123663195 isoform X2 n=1 Tax=Melitaea cinxia TaxID=113334 RepID=UPI001E2701DA|nr:uncharacterized protein LOC123663195 isoform X2 [Melitaea cinxia]
MGAVWVVLVIIFTVLENVISEKMSLDEFDKIPLSKSLGFSTRKNFGQILKEAKFGHDYVELYNEMMKSSQESSGLEDIAEDDSDIASDLTRLKRITDNRRHARMKSSVGRRRARSQALRREKLNSQSLRSHREHSRHTSIENKFMI